MAQKVCEAPETVSPAAQHFQLQLHAGEDVLISAAFCRTIALHSGLTAQLSEGMACPHNPL